MPRTPIFRKAMEKVAELTDGQSLPIDLHTIAARVGVVTIEQADIRTDAYTRPSGDGRYAVRLKRDSTKQRQAFSLAHEIGHILIANELNDRRFTSGHSVSQQDKQLESSCDKLAVELLMPAARFKEIAKAHGWGMSSVSALSRTFGSSFEATIRRCVEMADNQLTAIKWRFDHKSEKPQSLAVYGSLVSEAVEFSQALRMKGKSRVLGFDRTAKCLTPWRASGFVRNGSLAKEWCVEQGYSGEWLSQMSTSRNFSSDRFGADTAYHHPCIYQAYLGGGVSNGPVDLEVLWRSNGRSGLPATEVLMYYRQVPTETMRVGDVDSPTSVIYTLACTQEGLGGC